MIKFSATLYYITSLYTLITGLNFWLIPFVFFKKPLLIKTKNNLQFYVWNIMDIWAIKEIVLDRQYQFYKEEEKHWIVIDIGAGIADFNILISKRVRHIYAFDADENRIFLARKNISLNNINNITIVKEKVKSLGKIFHTYKIQKCDLLKIDCEGYEYIILENVSKNILKKIKRIVMEIHLFTPSMKMKYRKLKKQLQANGFIMKEKKNPVHEYLLFLYAEK